MSLFVGSQVAVAVAAAAASDTVVVLDSAVVLDTVVAVASAVAAAVALDMVVAQECPLAAAVAAANKSQCPALWCSARSAASKPKTSTRFPDPKYHLPPGQLPSSLHISKLHTFLMSLTPKNTVTQRDFHVKVLYQNGFSHSLCCLSFLFFSLGIAPHPEYKLSLSGCTMRKELMRQTKHGAQVLLQGE